MRGSHALRQGGQCREQALNKEIDDEWTPDKPTPVTFDNRHTNEAGTTRSRGCLGRELAGRRCEGASWVELSTLGEECGLRRSTHLSQLMELNSSLRVHGSFLKTQPRIAGRSFHGEAGAHDLSPGVGLGW